MVNTGTGPIPATTTSNVGNFFSGINSESIKSFFSTWSGRGIEFARNIPAHMQQSDNKFWGVIIAANVLFLAVLRFTILPALERQTHSKDDDSSTQQMKNKLIKAIVLGSLIAGFNYGLGVLTKCQKVNNIALLAITASVLALYFGFRTPAKPAAPVETPEQVAVRLEAAATATAETLQQADAAYQTAQQTEATAKDNLQNALQAVLAAPGLIAQRTAELQQARVNWDQIDQNVLAIEQDVARRALDEEAVRAEHARLTAVRKQAQDALNLVLSSEEQPRADFETAQEEEAQARNALTTAQEAQQANTDNTKNAELAKAVIDAQQAVLQAEQNTAAARGILEAAELTNAPARQALEQAEADLAACGTNGNTIITEHNAAKATLAQAITNRNNADLAVQQAERDLTTAQNSVQPAQDALVAAQAVDIAALEQLTAAAGTAYDTAYAQNLLAQQAASAARAAVPAVPAQPAQNP